MKKLVTEYNVCTSPDPELSMEAVLNPQSTLFDTNVSSGRRLDIIQAYLRKIRSLEEIQLLKVEMERTLHYFEQKEKTLRCACKDLAQCNDQFSRGTCNILTHLKWKVELCILKTKEAFEVIDSPESDNNSDISSESDSDCDDV